MADPDYNGSVVIEQGAAVLRVKSGGKIVLDAGGTLDVWAGTFSGGGTETEITNGQTLLIDNGAVLDASAANAADVKLPNGAVDTDDLAAGAATLAKVDFTGIKTLKGAGVAAPGAATLTGAAVGDRVVAIIGNLTAGGPLLVFIPGTDFEATISVINQIQQLSAADLHLTTVVVILAPAKA